jgi:single-strand DNA-binding protein
MNALNSILIEGNLIADPVETNSGKMKSCSFQIENERFIKEEGIKKSKTCSFEIEAHGKFAENCLNHLEKGRGCRVVGRLITKIVVINIENSQETVEYEKVVIHAEHVEFKPVKTNG